MSEWAAQVERLRSSAAALAGPLAAMARRRTTLGQERAILRLLGVDGLDRAGRPLAASVVEQCCSRPGALAAGVALPFGVALSEYAMSPRDLALEVASGAVDLGLEGDGLADAALAETARTALAGLVTTAVERIDANRTAGRELRAVLGEGPLPWIGLSVTADESETAVSEVREAVAAGAGAVRVRVPAGWEFRRAIGRERREQKPAPGRSILARRSALDGRPDDDDRRDAPPGSQRGLSLLRDAADQSAAARGCYASLMTVTAALAAPEQAVVAALERIDFVEADAVREIVEGNVDPDRAIADHAFAHRLHQRSGARVLVGSGPLAIAPEIEAGIPAGLALRAGRALALQAIEIELALADGLGPDRLVVGALPTWVPDDGGVAAVVAQAWLRAVVFPELQLSIDATLGLGRLDLVGALAGIRASGRPARNGVPLLLLMDAETSRSEAAVADARQVAAVAGEVADSVAGPSLRSNAASLANETLDTANAVLEQFAADGWASVLGRTGQGEARLGASGVVERDYNFDPLATAR